MPPKVYTCVICGQTVTRRKSLSLETLGGGEGRACRDHQQVADLVQTMEELKEAQHQRQEEELMMSEVIRKLRVMSAATTLRILHSTGGLSPETFYARLRMVGYPNDMIKDIHNEVDHQGGPLMNQEELLSAMIGAVDLHRRGVV